MADTEGPVYLIVDGHPTHRAKLVKQFVAATDGALKLFVLPAYSPRLNPTSGCGRTSIVPRGAGMCRMGVRVPPSSRRRSDVVKPEAA
jgi:DDE superfamily endonuclease